MPTNVYEVEIGGETYEVEADSVEQAAKAAEQFVGGAAPETRRGVGYKNVKLPSGEVVAFPGDMPDEEINGEIRTFLASKARRPVQMPRLYGARGAPQFRNLTAGEEAELRSGERVGAGLAAVAPVVGLAGTMVPALVASPVGRGLAAVGGVKAFEKTTGVNVPWWAETAVDAAAGGTAIKGAKPLLKALLRLALRGETGAGAAAAGAVAAPAAAEATTTAARAALANLSKPLTQAELSIVSRLQGLAKVAGNRAAIKQATKETFGDDWQTVWRFIMAPHTRI